MAVSVETFDDSRTRPKDIYAECRTKTAGTSRGLSALGENNENAKSVDGVYESLDR